MSTTKRCISLLLALIMVLGLIPWDALSVEAAALGEIIHVTEEPVRLIQSEKPVANSDGIAVTRAQWLQMLVTVFGYHIEDEIVPDNYFPDLHEDAEYYEDILTAVYYGLVDVLPNSPLEPDAAATREFAVSTMNACMGYLPESEPTFDEAEEVTYPDDIQVALEQGWFTLTAGTFLPQQPITAEEFALLQTAAESYVDEFTIVPAESQYSFKDGVIEITDKAQIETVDDVDIVTITNCAVDIAAGDKFVVYSGGLAIPYTAESVTLDGADTVIVTSELAFEDAIETMLVQQKTDTDPANFYAAEGAELIFIEEETGQEYSQQAVIEQMATGSTKVYIPKFSMPFELPNGAQLSLSVELKNSMLCANVDIGLLKGNAEIFLDTDVEVSGKLSCDVDKVLDNDIEIYIGGYSIPGVGGLSVYVKVDVTGSLSVINKYHMKAGINVEFDAQKWKGSSNLIFELTDKGSCYNAEISSKVCLQIKCGVYGKALPFSGYFYGEGGFKATVKYTTYEEIEGSCTHFAAYMYAKVGAVITWGMFDYQKELEIDHEIINENNSPVKIGFHYEDGKYVYGCTRKGMTGTATGDPSKIVDSGYLTGYDSSYYSSGWSRGGSSTGYGYGGEPIIIYTYFLDENNNATITSYEGNATSLTIPLMLDGYNVTTIGNGAFEGNTDLQTVIMQDNILTIWPEAFKGCVNLRNLTWSESLTEIGWSAFENCTSLTSVSIPDSVTDIGGHAFENCRNLQYVSLSKGLTYVEYSAFKNCISLTEITIPKSLDEGSCNLDLSPENGIFYGSGLFSVKWEEGATQIASNLFLGCSTLKTVEIPETVTIIEHGAFAYSGLENITIPNAVTEIESYAFYNCNKLTSADISDSVTIIDDGVFSNCSKLTNVKLSEGLTYIGYCAFENCVALTEITIPKSLDEVWCNWYMIPEHGIFYGSGLSSVKWEEGATQIASNLFLGCSTLKTVEIPETVTIIESGAFAYSGLESITIPNAVTEIESYAFSYCDRLISADISDSVTIIDDGVFSNCSQLANVTLSKGLTYIGYCAFENCVALTEITIPKSLDEGSCDLDLSPENGIFYGSGLFSVKWEEGATQIASNLFLGCSALKTVDIPETVTIIEHGAFAYSGLENITIPNTVTEIGDYAFLSCTKLKEAGLPEHLVLVPYKLFYECSTLNTITIPDSVSVIDDYAFYGCTALEEITLPKKLNVLGECCFENCDSLASILIPGSVIKIDHYCFYDCDALTTITIPYGVSFIGDSAFYDCDALETMEMANSVTRLGDSAFYHCDVLKNVKLSRNLNVIPYAAFKECAELEQIVIPYFTTEIHDNAFNSSPKLTKVVTHEKLESISNSAFSYADHTVFYGPSGSNTETWCTDNGFSFQENTTVTTAVTPAQTNVSIPNGTTYMLDFDIDPIDFHEVITTKSSNADVATMDETGLITAIGPGTATIKIMVGGASASCKVTVTQSVKKITLDKRTLSLEVPQTYQLTATVTPDDASNKTLNWTSSNPAAATVDANGLVTAVGNGAAVITAEATDGTGVTASCTVTVIDPSNIPVTSIQLDQTNVKMEAMDKLQITATVEPENAVNKGIIWTTSDEAVASVDQNGLVTAHAKGTATITATAADGYGATATCTVNVTNNGYLVTDLDQFQSSHPYGDNCHDFWLYQLPGAGSVSITFAAETEMEDGFDYLYIYDRNRNLIGKYTGTELANQTITVTGDTVRVQIESDDSGNAWGFQVINVDCAEHTHSFTNYVSDGNATCTQDGTKTAKCDSCDETDTIPDPGSASGHDMGSWITVSAPTCTEDGEEQGTCTRCDHSETRSIDALGHNFTDWEYNDANELMRTCIICSLVEMREVDRLFTVGGESSNPDMPMEELRELYDLVDWSKSASYVTQPSTSAPYAAGRLTDECLNNLVAQVNFFRAIARLDDIGWCENYVTLAQHAAVVNAANGQLSHYPSQPADMEDDFYDLGYRGASSSNLAYSYGLMSSVLGYLADSDSSNIDRVGHRRWVLNPYMADTGFGNTGAYSAMYAHDHANKDVDFDYVAFPGGSSVFPNEFFDGYYAWSAHLSWDTFEIPSLDDLRVTLTRESDGKEWIFDTNTSGTGNYYFNLDTAGYGDAMAIIFRPDSVSSYQGKYTVRITGLWTTDGEGAAIEYTVDFRSIESQGCDHRPEVRNAEDATCTEDGYTGDTYCSVCGELIGEGETILATGHSYGNWYQTVAPGCEESGEERRDCNNCDHYESRTVEPLGHEYEDGTCIGCGEEDQDYQEPVTNPFTDVPEDGFFYEPVMWAVANGITNGTSATTFGPNDQCMRAHVVTFLWRAVGSPEPTRTDNHFVDVPENAFYYKPVMWALENGITSGLDATHFGPTAYCNRAQVVTFLYRAMESPEVTTSDNPFTDVPDGQWFTAPVLWAVENGITNGLSATSFGPNSICNRAQIVTFLYRAFN